VRICDPSSGRLRLVATCALGLEEFVETELLALGVERVERDRGGVSFDGDWPLVWRSNRWLRTANRVLVELAQWPAPDDEALYRGALDLARGRLAEFLHPARSLALQATSTRSQVRDTRWAALRVKDGLVDAQRQRWGRRADVEREAPDLPLRLRLQEDQATLLLDTSGEPLDRRGYRRETVEAPMRETLAAACVLASGWTGEGAVLDPMCGSGTLLAEAGWFALGTAPSVLRERFAFEKLPGFDAQGWARVKAQERPRRETVALFGNDRSPSTLEVARRNLRVASLESSATLTCADFGLLEPPAGPGLLLANPPYGERLEAGRAMWRALGDLMKHRFRGWRVAILAGGEGLGKEIGLKPRRRIPVWNGPLEARILLFDLY